MDIIERDIYVLIASGDGIKAREIAKKLNKDRSIVNHYLYNSPYMKDLCYRNENYEWYGLIRQSRTYISMQNYRGRQQKFRYVPGICYLIYLMNT